ncbi:MAG: hypothetical protein ACOYO9_10740 [Candidatus Nanopelagicales bacterium]|jgi:hypothetical protein
MPDLGCLRIDAFPRFDIIAGLLSAHLPLQQEMNSPTAGAESSWTVRLDSRRRPTLPDEVLRSAGLVIGETLRVHVAEEGCLIIETPAHALRRARSRIASRPNYSVVDEFLAERAREVH